MGKRKKGTSLWLNRPKKHGATFTTPRKNVCTGRPKTPSTWKYCSPWTASSPCKTPGSKSKTSPGRLQHHTRTPGSSKKIKKRLVLGNDEECTMEEDTSTPVFDDIPDGAKFMLS